MGPGERDQSAEHGHVALDAAAAFGVQDVYQIAVGSHADREHPTGADNLAQGRWSPRTAKTETVLLPAFTA